MRNRILTFLFLFFCLTLVAEAQSVRKYSNEFLKIGVGARAAAMGNAMTGIVDDVTSAYWNPGGLSLAPATPEIALMHSEYFAGIAKYDYIGFTMPIGDTRRFGASVIRLGVHPKAVPPTRLEQVAGLTPDPSAVVSARALSAQTLTRVDACERQRVGDIGVGLHV